MSPIAGPCQLRFLRTPSFLCLCSGRGTALLCPAHMLGAILPSATLRRALLNLRVTRPHSAPITFRL